MTVGLYVRITVNGKQRYCRPAYAANKKLRAGHAVVGGKVPSNLPQQATDVNRERIVGPSDAHLC